MRIIRFATLALTVVLTAPFALGQNLVVNPDFDTDVADWTPGSSAAINWSSLDTDGDPASGSGLVTNLSTTPSDSTGAHQCIDGLVGETFFHFAADILFQGGQSETGYAELFVQWNANPGCNGYLGGSFTDDIFSSTPDTWYRVSEVAQAPSGTQAARLRLSVLKWEDSGNLSAHFDKVVFEIVLFADGFESGDTSSWSITVP